MHPNNDNLFTYNAHSYCNSDGVPTVIQHFSNSFFCIENLWRPFTLLVNPRLPFISRDACLTVQLFLQLEFIKMLLATADKLRDRARLTLISTIFEQEIFNILKINLNKNNQHQSKEQVFFSHPFSCIADKPIVVISFERT